MWQIGLGGLNRCWCWVWLELQEAVVAVAGTNWWDTAFLRPDWQDKLHKLMILCSTLPQVHLLCITGSILIRVLGCNQSMFVSLLQCTLVCYLWFWSALDVIVHQLVVRDRKQFLGLSNCTNDGTLELAVTNAKDKAIKQVQNFTARQYIGYSWFIFHHLSAHISTESECSMCPLQGVKGNIKDAEVQPPTVGAAIFAKEKQQELQEDLERQFSQGLRKWMVTQLA